MNKIKRIISVICIIGILICMTSLNSFAAGNQKANQKNHSSLEIKMDKTDLTERQQEMVREDFSNLSILGIPNEKTKIVVLENRKIAYQYEVVENVIDTFTVDYITNDDVLVTVTEGDLEDTILLSSDGTIFVNGMELPSVPHPIINMANNEYSLTPFGSSSAYTTYTYIGQSSNANVGLTKKVISHTISALATIIASYVGMPSAFSSLLSDLASYVIQKGNQNNPTSTSLSYKQTKYERSDSMGGDRYYKYYAVCYPAANYAGGASSQTYYQHYYFT